MTHRPKHESRVSRMDSRLAFRPSPSALGIRLTPRQTHGFSSFFLSIHRAPLMSLDFLMAGAGYVAFSWFAPYVHFGQLSPDNLNFGAIFAATYVVSALGLGYYERENRYAWKQFIILASLAWAIATVLSFSVFHILFFIKVGRIQLLASSLGALAVALALRSALAFLLSDFSLRYAILGMPSPITDEIRKPERYSRIGQHYSCVQEIEQWLSDPRKESPEELLGLLHKRGVAEVVLTREAAQDERLVRFSMAALSAGYRVVDEVTFYTEVFERYPVETLSENWILFSGINTHRHLTNFLKRAFDIVASLIALVVLSPLFLLLTIVIRISSPGPVIFTQDRQGRFNVPFRIYKFRTMYVNAPNGFNPPSTRQNDPRLTPGARWIRPLHLDELPQLLNILKGDMSFVGPRPEDLRFVERIRKEVPVYEYRHLLRPGLTGPAQIQLGYTLDNVEDTYRKLSYDLYYLRYNNAIGDIVLILRTLFFLTRNAR
jgi:lipopolysaccharide/colanic/teichoic acid biosynthesis glycosyltransferase